MTSKAFFIFLTIMSSIVAAVLFGFQRVEMLKSYSLLSWTSFGFFVVFTLALFWGAKRSVKSENKHMFSQFFLAATVIKMLTSLTIVLIYFLVAKPATQYFIIPFFFVYLCFTIFEVYFMTKLGNTK